MVSDGTTPPLKSGQDIRNAFYAVDDGYKYFRPGDVLNQTASVAPPIPSAALLLGTGVVCLIGLRRRGVHKT